MKTTQEKPIQIDMNFINFTKSELFAGGTSNERFSPLFLNTLA
jgi:hypothetical protein